MLVCNLVGISIVLIKEVKSRMYDGSCFTYSLEVFYGFQEDSRIHTIGSGEILGVLVSPIYA